MTGVRQVLSEQRKRFARRECIWRECRVGNDSDESKLCERAGRPACVPARSEPTVRQIVVLVRRPQERRQDVQVEKRRFHGTSSRS